MELQIVELKNTAVVAGKLTTVTKFIVADASGELVGKKAHDSLDKAEAEKEGLAGYGEGLAFCKAIGVEGKAAVGKANVIAQFLAYVAAGKPAVFGGEEPAVQGSEE